MKRICFCPDNNPALKDSQTAPTQVFDMSDIPTQTFDDHALSLLDGKKVNNSEDISTLCYNAVVGSESGRSSSQLDDATQVIETCSGKQLVDSVSSSLEATQVFNVSCKSNSQSDLATTQVFDVQSESQTDSKLAPTLTGADVTETQVLHSSELLERPQSDERVKRLSIDPHTSSTQTMSESEDSCPRLQLELSDCIAESHGSAASAVQQSDSHSSAASKVI